MIVMDSTQKTLPSSVEGDSEQTDASEKSLRAGKNKMLKPARKNKMVVLSYDKGA